MYKTAGRDIALHSELPLTPRAGVQHGTAAAYHAAHGRTKGTAAAMRLPPFHAPPWRLHPRTQHAACRTLSPVPSYYFLIAVRLQP